MNATASLLADTICRTVELGVTITDAAVAGDFTHLFCAPATIDPVCWQIGLVGTAGPASWYRHSGDPEPARV